MSQGESGLWGRAFQGSGRGMKAWSGGICTSGPPYDRFIYTVNIQ